MASCLNSNKKVTGYGWWIFFFLMDKPTVQGLMEVAHSQEIEQDI